MIEGGFAWLPSLMWRLDQHWARHREEVPHVTRPPSEIMRQGLWITTQPMEEPERAPPAARPDRVDRLGPAAVRDRLPALGLRRSERGAAALARAREAPGDLLGERAQGLPALMERFVVARADEIPPGGRKLVEVRGRDVVVFNVEGEYFALLDRCPHQGGSLCRGKLVGPRRVRRARPTTAITAAARSSAAPGTAGSSTCAPASPGATPPAPGSRAIPAASSPAAAWSRGPMWPRPSR